MAYQAKVCWWKNLGVKPDGSALREKICDLRVSLEPFDRSAECPNGGYLVNVPVNSGIGPGCVMYNVGREYAVVAVESSPPPNSLRLRLTRK